MAELSCPICKRPVDERAPRADGDPFPFCSTRCKLVDLGAWLDGRYRIPGDPVDEGEREALSRLTSTDGGDA